MSLLNVVFSLLSLLHEHAFLHLDSIGCHSWQQSVDISRYGRENWLNYVSHLFFTVLLECTLLRQASENVPDDLDDKIWLNDLKDAFQPQKFSVILRSYMHTPQRKILSLPGVV